MSNSIETFIFVHDQKIILDFINHNKFENFENLKYVFLGDGDTSLIRDLASVIISRELKYNIENYPKLTSFTGWYSIWKNKLVTKDYLNLFEYDINLSNDFTIIQNEYLEKNDVIGYIPFNVHDRAFIKEKMWSDALLNGIKTHYGISAENFINNLPHNKICSVTSNHTFNTKIFEKYMLWMEPMINIIKESPLSGHQTERSISLFYLLNNLNYSVIPNILTHYQFDSHRTQGISQDKFNLNYHNLLK